MCFFSLQVTVDLTKLASSACSGLNLEEELKKQLVPSLPNTPPRNDRKRKIALTGPEAQKRLKEGVCIHVCVCMHAYVLEMCGE